MLLFLVVVLFAGSQTRRVGLRGFCLEDAGFDIALDFRLLGYFHVSPSKVPCVENLSLYSDS